MSDESGPLQSHAEALTPAWLIPKKSSAPKNEAASSRASTGQKGEGRVRAVY